jgi:hypothetical protein
MKEFKLNNRYFINDIVAIALAIIIGVALGNGLVLIILAVLILVVIYDLIKKYFLVYIISEEALIKKTFIKTNTIMNWKEVQTIVRLANVKNSIGVFSNNKKFIINPMIKDYKVMIRIIVEKCIGNTGVSIDPKVLNCPEQ